MIPGTSASQVKRSPSTESRAADLRPMGRLPLLIGTLVLLGLTLLRRGASLVVLALAVALPSDFRHTGRNTA